MTSLRKVALEGNPLRQLRPNVVSGPTPALLRTLADRIDDGSGAVGAEPQRVAREGNVFGLDERVCTLILFRPVPRGRLRLCLAWVPQRCAPASVVPIACAKSAFLMTLSFLARVHT